MHIHTVFFWLKEGLEESERQRFTVAAKKLGEIGLAKQCHVAAPVPSDREVVDDSFDFSLHMVFENTADQDAAPVERGPHPRRVLFGRHTRARPVLPGW